MSYLKNDWIKTIIFALLPTFLLCFAVGENPITVFQILVKGSLSSLTNLGFTLYFATPLIFTGLSVAWAFRSGLFNIGAEGQMAIGGVMALVVSLALKDWPAYLSLPLSFLAAAFFGGVWGFLAALIKTKRGAHEVLATILLNYFAYSIVSYLILGPLRNRESQSPETFVLPLHYQLPHLSWLGGNSPLNLAFIIAIIICLTFGYLLFQSKLGFQQRFVGGAPRTAMFSGLKIDRQQWLAMFIAGAFAGLASMSELYGDVLKLREGFTMGYGFVGIAVALVARTQPALIPVVAIFFGALQKGALDLDLDTESITRDLAVVMQAFLIIAVVVKANGGAKRG